MTGVFLFSFSFTGIGAGRRTMDALSRALHNFSFKDLWRVVDMKLRILRYSDLEVRLGLSRVTIWRRVRADPTFPRPIRLGAAKNSAIGFLEDEMEAWVEQQIVERNSYGAKTQK